MASKKPANHPKILAACAAKQINPALVVAVEFEPDDIFLAVRGMGRVRVERSALPASIEAMPDQPQAVTARARPAPKPASRARKSGKPSRKRARAKKS